MVLEEIMRAVSKLNDEERWLLLQHIDNLPEQATRLMPKERTRRLNAALDMLGDGLSQTKLDEITAALTEDYIEACAD